MGGKNEMCEHDVFLTNTKLMEFVLQNIKKQICPYFVFK